MKIRVGLVSNSSSASFIITIKLPPKEAYSTLMESMPLVFWPDDVIEDIEIEINRLTNDIKDIEQRVNSESYTRSIWEGLEAVWKKDAEERIEKLKELKTKVESDKTKFPDISTVSIRARMELEGIELEEFKDKITLKSHTTMLNKYIESLTPAQQELIISLSFERPEVLNLKIEKE